jgi:soluble lytic murein transglycosylase-like protein
VASASPENCQVSGKFAQSILQWCSLITKYANNQDIDPNLIASIMLQESGGDANAYSGSGAVGLLQVMPSDGIATRFGVFKNRPTIKQLKDPEFNIQYGTAMFSGLVSRYGNNRDALLHYGPMDVGYEGYADKVLEIYNSKK